MLFGNIIQQLIFRSNCIVFIIYTFYTEAYADVQKIVTQTDSQFCLFLIVMTTRWGGKSGTQVFFRFGVRRGILDAARDTTMCFREIHRVCNRREYL